MLHSSLPETPHNPPFITGIRARYRVGDILRGNCTSRHSRPAANLTWTVNNEEVSTAPLEKYRPTPYPTPTSNAHSTPLQAPGIMQTQFSCFQALASGGNLCVCFWKRGIREYGLSSFCNYQKNTRIRGDQRIPTPPITIHYAAHAQNVKF